MDWSPDGSRLIVAGKDDAVRVWDGDSGELLSEIPAREHFIRDIAFVSESRAIGVTDSGAVVLADFEAGSLATVAQVDARLLTMAWNPVTRRLSVGGYTGTVTSDVYGEVRDIDGFLHEIDLAEFVDAASAP